MRVARQVSHPNVCRVYDLGEADGQPYLSMEYVDGEDLSTLLKRIGHSSQDKGVELALQLCAGLAAAHDKGVLHRDLKPANLLLNSPASPVARMRLSAAKLLPDSSVFSAISPNGMPLHAKT